MGFHTEATGYRKTILSDLQGAWGLLRREVVERCGFDGWQRALLHIDEATSWESVRNLRRMPPLLLQIRNICLSGGAPDAIMAQISEVDEILREVLAKTIL